MAREEKEEQIVEFICNSKDKKLDKMIRDFTNMVQYRLIRPFYQGQIDHEKETNEDFRDYQINALIEKFNRKDTASKMEVWQVPKNIYEQIPVSLAELELKVASKGKIGRYLLEQMNEHMHEAGPRKSDFRTGETWVLGDSPAVGLLLYEYRFEFDWIQAPNVSKDMMYIQTKRNRPIRVYRNIDSRLILDDLFAKLALFNEKHPNGWKESNK